MMSSEDLVVGDIIKLQQGMEVPVDGYLINGESLLLDESYVLKESSVEKCPFDACIERKGDDNGEKRIPSPIILSGSHVLNGEGYMAVIVVGMKTAKHRKMIREMNGSKTGITKKLETLANEASKWGTISAIFVIFSLFLRFLLGNYGMTWQWSNLPNFTYYCIIGVLSNCSNK